MKTSRLILSQRKGESMTCWILLKTVAKWVRFRSIESNISLQLSFIRDRVTLCGWRNEKKNHSHGAIVYVGSGTPIVWEKLLMSAQGIGCLKLPCFVFAFHILSVVNHELVSFPFLPFACFIMLLIQDETLAVKKMIAGSWLSA